MGWGFKSVDELFKPSSEHWVTHDPESDAGFRPRKIEDDHAVAAQLGLGEHVSERIRDYFDAMRMLWVYGHLYYPFFSMAAVHAGLCMELALKERLAAAGVQLPRKKQDLDGRLEYAVAVGWLAPSGFTAIRNRKANRDFFAEVTQNSGMPGEVSEIDDSPEGQRVALLEMLKGARLIRNETAHPDFLTLMFPGMALGQLLFTRELIEQLFAQPNAQ